VSVSGWAGEKMEMVRWRRRGGRPNVLSPRGDVDALTQSQILFASGARRMGPILNVGVCASSGYKTTLAMPTASLSLEFHPVTLERLPDLARFSEGHGKFRYCSCMKWRMKSTEFSRATKEARVAALDTLVRMATPVGILAYLGEEPVGWCSVAPRETYGSLERYRALPRTDDLPVWAVVCFFVDSRVRRRNATLGLLNAAVAYACSEGADIIEGYPVESGARLYTYMGSTGTFRRAGFVDVTPVGQARQVMRYFAGADQAGAAVAATKPRLL
jgi:hypothetical protein